MDSEKVFHLLHKLGLVHFLIRFSKAIRLEILQTSHYNVDFISNQLCTIDMVTDSYMHRFARKWRFISKGALEVGLMNLNQTLKVSFGYPFVFPLAQGRLAENVLIQTLAVKGAMVPNNGLFITSRSNIEKYGMQSVEIPAEKEEGTTGENIFKGNIHIEKLKELVQKERNKIAFIYIECSNNANGGYPVSMKNIREVFEIATRANLKVVLDSSRIVENAFFIKKFEEGFRNVSLNSIVKDFCSCSHACAMSATKDFQLEKGGLIGLRLQETADAVQTEILRSGDGMSIRDKATMEKAVRRGFSKTTWVAKRLKAVEQLHKGLAQRNLPVLSPAAGHAVFLKMDTLSDSSKASEHSMQEFLAHLYIQSGIAASENYCTPQQAKQGIKLIRFAVPAASLSRRKIRFATKEIAKAWEAWKKWPKLERVQANSTGNRYMARYKLRHVE